MTKLIVLRGPSGSGKSTVAKALFDKTERKTCLIEQDYYRFIFKPYKNGGKTNSASIHTMIKDNVLTALNDGYDVILEGIISTKSYKNVLEEILAKHPSENYIFYFDVSLEETIRRHRARPPRNTPTYTEDDMRQFYSGEYEPIHDDERVIPETSSFDDTLDLIIESTSTSTLY